MPFKDLREFLTLLDEKGELLRTRKPVDVKFEISSYIRKTSDEQGPALLFHNVRNSKMPVLGGVFATRERAFLALETTPQDYVNKFHNALDHLVQPRLVSDAPCKEVIYTGKDVDLGRLPIPIFSEKDPAPFITLGLSMSRDPKTGGKNTSIYRLQVKGRNRLGIMAQQLVRQLVEAEGLGKGLPIAIAIGTDPVLPLATQWMAPYGTDELALAGALRREAVEVVKAETVDLEVPATAEIIIEGTVLPNVREEEGPFGEVSGYYTPSNPKPIIEISAITHRKDAIYQAALTGMPTTENHILKQLPLEASFYWQLKKEFPGVTAVHFPAAGTVGMTCVIAMKQAYDCEARNVIAAMIGTRRNKITIVVDDDVDIFDMEKVWWAIATRTQADEDIIIFPRVVATAMDPSVRKLRVGSSLGIDATKPFGQRFPEIVKVPGADTVSLDDLKND
ncbi:MAG TPA: UbiD family decarboxylase [Candidatus Binatia bacterium]|jgi:4-hydroxy-3-polyprenylbenzoate decarboxylase/2,5-furandicarboxylate decarboxylase 1